MEDSIGKVIGNSLLMEMITSDLPFVEVLNLRKVCRQWDTSVVALRRVQINLKIFADFQDTKYWESSARRFIETFKNTIHNNWRMRMRLKVKDVDVEAPLHLQVAEEFGCFIRTLEVEVHIYSSLLMIEHRDVTSLKRIFKGLTGLEVLKFSAPHRGQTVQKLKSIPSILDLILEGEDCLSLPKLRRLKWDEKLYLHSPDLLEKAVPSLEVLEFGCVDMRVEELTQKSLEWKGLSKLTLMAFGMSNIPQDFTWLKTLSSDTVPKTLVIEEIGWNSKTASQSEKVLFSGFLNARRAQIRSLELSRPLFVTCETLKEISEEIRANSLLGGSFDNLQRLKTDVTFVRNLKRLMELTPVLETLELFTCGSFRYGDVYCTNCKFHDNLWSGRKDEMNLGVFRNLKTLCVSGAVDDESFWKLGRMFPSLRKVEIHEIDGTLLNVFRNFPRVKELKVRERRWGVDESCVRDFVFTGINEFNEIEGSTEDGRREEMLRNLRGGRLFIGTLTDLEVLDLREMKHCKITDRSIEFGLRGLKKLRKFLFPPGQFGIPRGQVAEFLNSLE